MFLASLVLMISTGLCLFYFRTFCERILRREFDRPYFRAIVYANRLEFPHLRKLLQRNDSTIEYSRLRTALQCDLEALTFLLRNARKGGRTYSVEELLLVVYFQSVLVSLSVRNTLKWRTNAAVMKLIAILQYFANVVGQHVEVVRLDALALSKFVN